MQMVGVYSTIANDGETVPPRLLDAKIDGRGRREVQPRHASHRVVSEQTAATMTQMLTEVVRGGTGACAAIDGYTVAGKTGTSRKVLPQGGYGSATMASFVGFAPADDPRLAAIVVLDEPLNEYGSVAAAPVFSEIVRAGLMQYRVPPTDTGEDRQVVAAHAHAQDQGSDCSVPHGDEASRRAAALTAKTATASTSGAAAGATEAASGPDPADEDPDGTPGTLAADTSQSE
jgi:membrane peptidoglycan carboxypeptidase